MRNYNRNYFVIQFRYNSEMVNFNFLINTLQCSLTAVSDPRYEQHQKRSPKWLQNPLKIHRNTCTATPSLQDFFRSKQGPTTAPVHEMKMKEEEPLAPPPTVECYLNPSSSQPSLRTSVTQKPKRKKIEIVSPHIMASLSQDESCTSE